MKQNKRKHPITLIEIMIVILLIGLIGGALAFNMRGSVDKGRAFKTEQNIARVYDVLMLEYAKGESSLSQIVSNRQQILQNCPFLKNGSQLLKDGWNQKLRVTADKQTDQVKVISPKLEEWKQQHGESSSN